MKNLKEYTNTVSAYELYTFLCEAVVEGRIISFSSLLDFVADLPRDARFNAVIPRIFKYIRKLYWGFFSDLDAESYPKVWRELVIPDSLFKNCGSLKRNLTISNVYVGILDLHGYTRFCEKNKNNLSMLQMLDDMIQVDVVKLAQERNVVLQRRHGDEMIMVGVSACDLIEVTLLIREYFSKKRIYDIKGDSVQRSGYKIILEEMHISAGIAGGKKFTPFIITRDGDLSGGVVNTAARLQNRANELSSAHSRILISRTVAMGFLSEMKMKRNPFFSTTPIRFFDSGWITFKGISVALCEVLFTKEDHQKLLYEPQMTTLFKMIEAGLWKDGVFDALMVLLIRVFKTMPKFKLDETEEGRSVCLKNDELCFLSEDIRQKFLKKQNYAVAIEKLENLVGYIKHIPFFDGLCMEYTLRITENYRRLVEEFNLRTDKRIEEKMPVLLPAKHRALYEEGRKGAAVYKRLHDYMLENLPPLEVSLLWSSVVDEAQDTLNISIHSGKL